jgi:hypothetical protein
VTRLLLVSNGHGEDVIAATVARRLRAAGVDLARPLVGAGGRPTRPTSRCWGRRRPPLGRLPPLGTRALIGDLRAGWLRSTRPAGALRAARPSAGSRAAGLPPACAGCVVVGDWYALTSAWRRRGPSSTCRRPAIGPLLARVFDGDA